MSNVRRSQFAMVSLLTLLGGGSVVTACGSGAAAGGPGGFENTGEVGLELKVGGVTLDSLSYTISGNGFSKTGAINVTNSKTIATLIGGIPAGNGYTIALSGADASDSTITCTGTATFNITAGSTTTAVIRLLCILPSGNGGVIIQGSANVCPRIDAVSIEPSEVVVGASMALSASITDSDALPAPATFAWTSTGGTLSGGSTANPSFTCTAPGDFTVSLTVSDGDCSDATSATVTCSPSDGEPPALPKAIKINEIESSGGVPGDWTELYNAEPLAVDLSGWVLKDNDDTHVYTFPAGTTIAAGGYLVVEEAQQSFGLGSADSVRLFDTAGNLVDSHGWSAHAATTYGRCTRLAIPGGGPNGLGGFVTSSSVTKGAANDCSVQVKINEVESSGGVPGDWTELYNAGAAPADLSSFVFKDNDDTHVYTFPAGTVIAPGGFLVIEEAQQGFGLGAAESARLFDSAGVLVDSYSWAAHAAVTYGRCPDGSGAFATTTASTKGVANACAPVGPVTQLWPGPDDVQTVDGTSVFSSNLSGLTYEGAVGGSPAVLWAAKNGPGTLYRLVFDGAIWAPDPANDWSAGKALRYPDGSGNPDSESVTFASSSAAGVYVATERNNDASTISRLSILRFDVNQPGAALIATHDWNLTSDLPVVGANLGLEAITFVPDELLVGKGFFDELKGHVYAPAEYPNHAGGLFFVGVEGTGSIHVYALDHASGAFSRLATISSGNPGVMGLELDRETGYLWSVCDDTCGNRAAILDIDSAPGSLTLGRFFIRRQFARPTTLPNINNEGIAIAPEAECVGGFKPFFWADDGETAGHSIRRDSIPCGAFL